MFEKSMYVFEKRKCSCKCQVIIINANEIWFSLLFVYSAFPFRDSLDWNGIRVQSRLQDNYLCSIHFFKARRYKELIMVTIVKNSKLYNDNWSKLRLEMTLSTNMNHDRPFTSI